MNNEPIKIMRFDNKITRCSLCNQDILLNEEHYVITPIETINNGKNIPIHVSCLDNNVDIAWEKEDE